MGSAAAQTHKQQIAGLAAAFAHILGQQARIGRGEVRIAAFSSLGSLDEQRLAAQTDVEHQEPAQFAIVQVGIGRGCNHHALM